MWKEWDLSYKFHFTLYKLNVKVVIQIQVIIKFTICHESKESLSLNRKQPWKAYERIATPQLNGGNNRNTERRFRFRPTVGGKLLGGKIVEVFCSSLLWSSG